jgi:hypothetical protein
MKLPVRKEWPQAMVFSILLSYARLYLVTSPLFYRECTGNNNRPQPGWQASQVDGSGHLFSMYVNVASEKDTDMAKSWKGDADGILVFVSQTSFF